MAIARDIPAKVQKTLIKLHILQLHMCVSSEYSLVYLYIDLFSVVHFFFGLRYHNKTFRKSSICNTGGNLNKFR